MFAHLAETSLQPANTPTLTYSEHYEVEAGVIVSARCLFERLELFEQLGVAPAPAHA